MRSTWPGARRHGTALVRQMEAAKAAQDWPAVLRKADYLIKRLPGNATATVYRLQGLAFLEEGEGQQGQEALEIALALVNDRQLRLTLLGDYTSLLASQNQWAKVLKQAREAPHLEPGASIDEKPHHPVMMTAKTRKEPRNAITSFLLKNYVYFYRGKPIFFYTIHV